MIQRNPTSEMLADLTKAAELRAAGLGWEAIASELKRSPSTCRCWPTQYRDHWRKLYRTAEKWLAREAGAEARAFLRKLLRSEDEKVCLSAGKVLLADRNKPRPPRKPDAMSAHDAQTVAEVRSLSHEEVERAVDDFIARRSAPDDVESETSARQSE